MLLELLIISGASYVARTYRQNKAKESNSKKTILSRLPENRPFKLNVTEEKKIIFEEKEINEDFIISSTSLSLSILGNLAYPPLRILSVLGWTYVSLPAFKQAIQLAREKKVDVNTIFSITYLGCLSSNYYTTGNLAAFFYVLSKKLFLKLKRDSKENLIDIFSQHPKDVWLVVNNTEIKTPFESLKKGDVVVVGAGEVIPSDGIIIEGSASVDQHILTGEAEPVEKEINNQVFGATIVLTGKIYLKVTKAGEESTAAQIGHILNQTTHFKSTGQLRAENLTNKTIIPTLILGGLAFPFMGFIGAVTVINSHFGYRMTVTSSVVMLSYLQVIAHKGILIKNGEVLDLLPQVDTIIFDKTGTLTLSQPTVGQIHTTKIYTENEILAYAASAEYKQTHPIALAILHQAETRGLKIPEVKERSYQVGYGLSVHVGEKKIRLGSVRFMKCENISVPKNFQAAAKNADIKGYSLVMLAINDEVAGIIELFPTVRPEAKEIITQLKQQGLIKTSYIISGDSEAPTKKLASHLGVDHYFAGVLPEKKASIVEQLQAEGKTVCYIGDGINDSIALKKAQVSISLRGASTIATDTAQIILMNGDLTQLGSLFESAREFDKTMTSSYKAILTPSLIAAGGVLFLGFNLVSTILLKQLGLTIGLANATYPLLKQKHSDESDPNSK